MHGTRALGSCTRRTARMVSRAHNFIDRRAGLCRQGNSIITRCCFSLLAGYVSQLFRPRQNNSPRWSRSEARDFISLCSFFFFTLKIVFVAAGEPMKLPGRLFGATYARACITNFISHLPTYTFLTETHS